MPAYTEVQGLAAMADFVAQQAVVQPTAGGAPWNFAEVLSVKKSAGIVPGKAVISIRNVALPDETGPITISDANPFASKTVKFWSRVNITHNGIVVFTGALMSRRDSLSGNAIILEYWDDRWMLQGIPLVGCLMYDSYSSTVILNPRMPSHVNPGGLRNCSRIASGSDVFVFCEAAERGTTTLENDATVGQDEGAVPGTAIYWTPERWLKHLQYRSSIYTPPQSTPYYSRWASMDLTKLTWASISFQAGGMQKKMPDTNFKGQTVLGAGIKGLEISGEYELGMDYSGNYIQFFKTTKGNANSPDAIAGRTFNLQRGGAAADCKSIFDGTAEINAANFKPASLTEGAPYRIESEFRYSNGMTAGDSLIPAWSSTEQTNFLAMIQTGKDPAGNILPTGIAANSIQAVQIARASYPKPFRAFQIFGTGTPGLDGIMAGVGNALVNYPFIRSYRKPMEEQLQAYFEDVNDISSASLRGRLRIPIRIQISDVDVSTGSPKYHDVTYNNGLRITADGLIWLDGLTDDLGSTDMLYTLTLAGFLGTTPTTPKLRYMKINMAVEHDVRVWDHLDLFGSAIGTGVGFGAVDYNNVGDVIDTSLGGKKSGPYLQHYVLNPEGFINEQQVLSNPIVAGAIKCSDGKTPPSLVTLTTLPVSGTLYNNQSQLAQSNARTFRDQARLEKTSTWRFPGIRADINVGDFVDKIAFQGGDGGEYKISSPVMDVHYDFKAQETAVTTR